jgi:hypothetical protein
MLVLVPALVVQVVVHVGVLLVEAVDVEVVVVNNNIS